MTLWRYRAIRIPSGTNSPAATVGELSGASAADVRATLRRIGLQVIDLRPVKSSNSNAKRPELLPIRAMQEYFCRHLRARRTERKAELYDSLATMLGSGLTLLDAIEAIIASEDGRVGHTRTMLTHVREQLRGGAQLSTTLSEHQSWFDESEVAMINSGQHGGNLNTVLGNLAARQERFGELSSKLVSALAYPTIVAVVAIGVVLFLSVKTLPDLTEILVGANIPIPALTQTVMNIGQFAAANWLLLLCVVSGTLIVAAIAAPRLLTRGPKWMRKLYPAVLRRLAVARFAEQLAELKQCGVPIVEALRVIAPTTGNLQVGLRTAIARAAERVERGEELSQALDDELWFDAEFRRLLEIGQASGDLDHLLHRIAERYSRKTKRLIDRLTAMLEPVVLLLLAACVGVVVMAAILPLLKLKEML